MKNTTATFALVVTLTACGTEMPPYGEVLGGFDIDPRPYPLDEVQSTVAEIVELIDAWHFHDFAERTATEVYTSIRFVPGPINCNGGEFFGCTRGASGLTPRIEVSAEYRLIGCTALMHELLHVADRGRDDDHQSEIWYAHGREASLEGRLYEAVCNEHIRAGEELHWTEDPVWE